MSISDIIMNIGYIEGKNLSFLEKDKDKKDKKEIINYDIEAAEYYDTNFRNCISRRPSIDYQEHKDDNNMINDKNLGKLITSLPLIFSKDKYNIKDTKDTKDMKDTKDTKDIEIII